MTALADTAAPARPTFRRHVLQTLRLAGPVIVARSGVLIMIAVDTAMTGHFAGEELAYLGLGLSPTIALTLLGLGFLLGVSVLCSQADGAGEPRRAGHIWRVGLGHAVVVGLFFAILCQFGEPLLKAIGQAPDLAAGGGEVMRMLGYGLPAVMIFVASSFFLEGIGRPVPGMLVMLGANVVNFGLNWLLIYGVSLGGLTLSEPMGAAGAALATTLVRWLTAIVIIGYIWIMPERERYGIRGGGPRLGFAGRRLRSLGFPIGIAMFIEVAAFMAMTQLAGLLGPYEIAGYQIAHNLVALVFMSAIGLGAATGIRVGNAVGREDPPGVRMAGMVGVGLVAAAMALLGSTFVLIPDVLLSFYTTEAAVAAMAMTALGVAATMMMFDGSQAVLMNALRGLGDVWVPMGLQFVAFWLLALPAGYVFAFRLGLGTAGLMGGIYVGCVAATLFAGLRFAVVSRRPLSRA